MNKHQIQTDWFRRSQTNPEGRKQYETKCPATGEVLASTVQGTEEDVEAAVSAAKTAHVTWSQLPGHVRARHLYAIARHVQKHQRLIRWGGERDSIGGGGELGLLGGGGE